MNFKMVHQNFNVSDLEKSIAFYKKSLGLFELRRKEAADGSFEIAFLGCSENDFELELTCLLDHPQKYDLGECEFHLAFKTDHFEEAHELHSQMGIICFENPKMGIYFIEDPDGYWLEIVPNRHIQKTIGE